MAEKKLKILTIRPSDDEEKEAIRYVMRESGCRTAAQAMIFACNAYRMNNERKKTFIDDIREKNKKNNLRQQRLINSLMAENERLHKALKTLKDSIFHLNDLSEGL